MQQIKIPTFFNQINISSLKRLMLCSTLFVPNCIIEKACAGDLESVMARLEKLELENKKIAADNKRIAGENLNLKDRLYRLEGAQQKIKTGLNEPVVKNYIARNPTVSENSFRIPDFESTARDENKNYNELRSSSKWVGFYGGLNVGYGWGTNSNASSQAFPVYDNGALPLTLNESNNYAKITGLGASALANTANFSVNQRGLVGGLQAGYNHVFYNNYIVGIEADIQGSTLNGIGNYNKTSYEIVNEYNDNLPPQHYYNNAYYTHLGTGSLSTNINWIGTIRGRLGYLVTPTLLIYGTAGFAYAGVNISSSNSFRYNANVSVDGQLASYTNYPWLINSIGGDGKFNQTNIGWAAGGGVEYMVASNLTLKGELLYYNLESVSFSGSPIISGQTYYRQTSGAQLLKDINLQKSNVAFDGLIARMGINYHFNTMEKNIIEKF